ncbi:MAG: phage major tail tube protein [Alphaproteobacteria bacterium]
MNNILYNFSVFVDGRGFIGKGSEVTLPKLTPKLQEYYAGGMSAPVDIPMNAHEKLEAEITLKGYDPEVLKLFSVTTGKITPFTVRGGLTDQDGAQHNMVIKMRGMVKEMDFGSWKPGDEAPLKLSLTLNYYKLEQGGQTLIEADPINMVMLVDGVDQLAATRKALGV